MKSDTAATIRATCQTIVQSTDTCIIYSTSTTLSVYSFIHVRGNVKTNTNKYRRNGTRRNYDGRTYVHTRGANGRCARWQRRRTFVTTARPRRLVVGRAGSCGCSPTELAKAGCSWLGRHSTGAYAVSLRTPTPLQRAKPRAPPSTFVPLVFRFPPPFISYVVSTVVYHNISVFY